MQKGLSPSLGPSAACLSPSFAATTSHLPLYLSLSLSPSLFRSLCVPFGAAAVRATSNIWGILLVCNVTLASDEDRRRIDFEFHDAHVPEIQFDPQWLECGQIVTGSPSLSLSVSFSTFFFRKLYRIDRIDRLVSLFGLYFI